MAYTSADPHDIDPFLQRRVTSVLAALCVLLFVFLVFAAIEASSLREWSRLTSPHLLIHLATLAGITAITVACWRGKRSVRQV